MAFLLPDPEVLWMIPEGQLGENRVRESVLLKIGPPALPGPCRLILQRKWLVEDRKCQADAMAKTEGPRSGAQLLRQIEKPVAGFGYRVTLFLEPSFEVLVTWAGTPTGGAQWLLFLTPGLLIMNRHRLCSIQQRDH